MADTTNEVKQENQGKIDITGNIFGHTGDKKIEKQIDYIREITLSKISTQEIAEIVKNFDAEVEKVLTHRKNEINKTYVNWIKAGWYKTQSGSINNVYSRGGHGMCFNCNKFYENREEAKKCNYAFIINPKNIPQFMSKNFIRLYLICQDCEKNASQIAPPKTWQEAVISSIYNQAIYKLTSLTEQTIKEKIIKNLTEKSETLAKTELDLNEIIAKNEERNLKLGKIIEKQDDVYNVKNKLLLEMMQNKKERYDILLAEEEELQKQINDIEERIINYRDSMTNKLEEFKTVVSEQISDISSNIKSSTLGKLSCALKTMDDNVCKVCFENPINIILTPCNHCISCEDCSNIIGDSCPSCRGHVTGRIKYFKS